MIVLPPGSNPTAPVEPAEIPCSNPPECELYDEQVARTLGWDKWEYTCWSMDPETPGKILHVNGYETKWYRAHTSNPRPPLAHGPPEWEIATGNMILIIRQPPPIS